MCILFLNVDPNPQENGYRLIVAANRDEYYKRPAKCVHKWDEKTIIGGEDMEPGREGGMWLGVTTKKGIDNSQIYCFSALLNITGEKISHADGRGCLVADYLHTSMSFPDYLKQLEDKGLHCNGYNLVAAELSNSDSKVYHHSNTPNISTVFSGKQTLGFGNSPTYSPLTKVTKGCIKFEEIIEKSLPKDDLVDELLMLLKDRTSHLPDDELKKRQPVAHEPLSSIYVQIEEVGYGTRTHSVILIDNDWNLEFIEHTMEEPIDIKNPKWIVNEIKSHL